MATIGPDPLPPVDLGDRSLELRRLGRWTWETYEAHDWLSMTGDRFLAFTARGAARVYRRRLKKWMRDEAQ